MKATILVFAIVFNLFSLIAAHGHVKSVTCDGKGFTGGTPLGASPPSPIRLINDNSPVKNLNGPEMTCGKAAQPGKLVAPVTAGSTISIAWDSGEGGTWPHNTGPLMDYLAVCGDDGCDNFDPTNAQWFKISQTDRRPDGQWRQQDLFEGKTASVTIPKNLPAGNYMLRHEILALHLAENRGGIEVYPSCIQLSVKASGNNQVDPSEFTPTAVFPGAYSLDDPGILYKHAFDADVRYPFPGPDLPAFITAANDNDNGGNDNGNGNNDSGNGSGNAQQPDTTSSASASASSATASPNGSGSNNNQQGSPKGAGSSPNGPASDESSTPARASTFKPDPTPAPSASLATVTVTVTVTQTAIGSAPTDPSDPANPAASASISIGTDPAGSVSPGSATPSVTDGLPILPQASGSASVTTPPANPASASSTAIPNIAYRHVGRLPGPHKMVRVAKRRF